MKSIKTKTLSTISRIYDGGLNPNEWPSIIDDLAVHFNATGSALFYSDEINPEIPPIATCYSNFWRTHRKSEYFEKVLDVEPSARMLRKRQPRTIVTNENLTLTEKLSILSYGLRMKKIFGIEAMLVSSLTQTGAWFDYITFQYDHGHGAVTPEEENQLKILVPHISKAIEISRPMAVLKQRFQRVLEALDHFKVGVLILSEKKDIIIKNETAQDILFLHDGLYINHASKLKAEDHTDNSKLQESIEQSIRTSQSDNLSEGSLIPIQRKSQKTNLLIEVSPIGDGKCTFGESISGAIVFMIDPDNPGNVSTQGMQELYNLSAAEATICQLLVDGNSNNEIADIRNVSTETVKSQVKSSLIKTKTANRSELIRKALAVNLPIDKP